MYKSDLRNSINFTEKRSKNKNQGEDSPKSLSKRSPSPKVVPRHENQPVQNTIPDGKHIRSMNYQTKTMFYLNMKREIYRHTNNKDISLQLEMLINRYSPLMHNPENQGNRNRENTRVLREIDNRGITSSTKNSTIQNRNQNYRCEIKSKYVVPNLEKTVEQMKGRDVGNSSSKVKLIKIHSQEKKNSDKANLFSFKNEISKSIDNFETEYAETEGDAFIPEFLNFDFMYYSEEYDTEIFFTGTKINSKNTESDATYEDIDTIKTNLHEKIKQPPPIIGKAPFCVEYSQGYIIKPGTYKAIMTLAMKEKQFFRTLSRIGKAIERNKPKVILEILKKE